MTTKTIDKPEILATDEHAELLLKEAFVRIGLKTDKQGWHRIRNWNDLPSRGVGRLFIVCSLDDLTRERIEQIRMLRQLRGRDKVFLLLKGEMPSRAVVDRMAWLDVRDDSRVHFAETDRRDEQLLAERFLAALDCGDDEHRILDAWWEEETLVVVSPAKSGFRKLRIPLAKLSVLRNRSRNELHHFKIDEDGLFLYWAELDVHLGWEQFEMAVDRRVCLKAKQQSDAFNRSYGSAIGGLRRASGLRQTDVKGLTARQVGRIERGECRATYGALEKLAQAHRMNLADYLDKLAALMQSA